MGAKHPIFGRNPFDVSPEEVFNKGIEMGLKKNINMGKKTGL